MHDFLVLYGSQTGQAEAIASEIHETAIFQNFKAQIFCLKDEGKKFKIEDVECAVFICSTTGDGDPPENARKFIRSFNRKTLPSDYLAKLNYALLGLGDSNYSTFCGGPKKLEKALKARGASKFYDTAFADDGVDLEDTVEPWIDGLFPALKSYFSSRSKDDSVQNVETEQNTVIDGLEKSKIELSNCKVSDSSTLANNINKLQLNHDENLEPDNTTTELEALQPMNTVTETLVFDPTALSSSPLKHFSSLFEQNISLPPLIQTYLEISFHENVEFASNSVCFQNGAAFPLAASELQKAKLVSVMQLSRHDAVKRALEVRLFLDDPLLFNPGDSFAICCKNDEREVNWLIERLSYVSKADIPARLSVKKETLKKNAAVPAFIPQLFTIRYAFTSCFEIRTVPKKPLLRALVDCTTEPTEKRRLEELCSRQGASSYMELIRTVNVTLLDILATFPSCKPPFELLAQHLPRLQPRRYSIANSPLVDPNHLTFVFNVVRFRAEKGLVFCRNGVCTGGLESHASLPNSEQHLGSNSVCPLIEIFLTKSTGFCLPSDRTQPLVMIGPGTGVAPFVGFLEHRSALKRPLGEAWLFYGCRHKDRDFLYEDKLKNFESNSVLTHLVVSFSRDTVSNDGCRYVQDGLRLHKAKVVDLLLVKNAVFYVCGDAKNMAKDVRQCIIDIIASETDCDPTVALEKFKKVLDEKRYKEDIWS